MTNVRTLRASVRVDAPYIPINVDRKHVGTQVQISRSTDFDNPTYMVIDKRIYLPDDILTLNLEFQGSLDEVVYCRYRYLFDSKTQPTGNPDFYIEEQWSRISSIRGDQSGVKIDNIVIATPRLTITDTTESILDRKITVKVDGFKVLMGSGEHKYTTWEIVDSNGNKVFSREKDVDNVKSIDIPMSIFQQGKLYSVKAKFVTDTNGESNYGMQPYLTNVVESEKFDLVPVLPFTQGQSLYFKLKLYTPNVTKVEVIVKEDRNDSEIEIFRKSDYTPSYSIVVPRETIESLTASGVSYKVYANITYTIAGKIYQSSTKFITRFTMEKTMVYPVNTYSKYPGRYALLNDIVSSASVVNTAELKNGTFLLADNSQTGFSLYGKYGDTIRQSNVSIVLPTDDMQRGTEFPYVNILPLYDDNILVNYAIFNSSNYKSSVWALYKADLANYTFDLITYKIFNDERYSTSLNSSAVVGKDGYVYYIPANYISTVPNTAIADISARFLLRDLNNTDGTFSAFIKNSSFGSGSGSWSVSDKTHYSVPGDMGYFKSTANNFTSSEVLSIDISSFTNSSPNGYSIQFDLKIPSTSSYVTDGSYPGIFTIADNTGNNALMSFGLDKNASSGSTATFVARVGTSDTVISTTVKKDETVRVTVIVEATTVKIYFGVALVETLTVSKGINYGKKFYLGRGVGLSNGSEFYFGKISFFSTALSEERLKQPEDPDETVNDVDLPLFRIKYDGSNLVREKLINAVKPGITRNLTMCPLADGVAGQEDFLILGGTDSTKVPVQDKTGANIPNVYYYHLSNREMMRFSTMTRTLSSIPNATIPASVPREWYSPEAHLRADSKIVLFNNAIEGSEAVNSCSYLLDFTKLGETDFFVKENDESTVNLPFRSTVRMRNGDFIRISHYDLSISKGLLYPHDTLTSYTDAEVTINKNLVVPVGSVITVPNLYIYDSVTIEGNYDPVTQTHNTGTLRWIDENKVRVFDYRDRIITRDTTVTSAEDRAMDKEHLLVLDGVNYTVRD